MAGACIPLLYRQLRVAFAVSLAFAAPLLRLVGMDGGGYHLKGESTDGKTTTMKAATSVCGGPDYWQTWRATGNALEDAPAAATMPP